MKPSRSEWITVRGLRYHLRHWGNQDAPKLFMLHGWMDVSASFQFMVDHLQHDWHVIAPDWRGFGLTQNTPADSYWFADYLADLDAILNHAAPNQAVNLIGHSMGGNVVALYAGVRPERVARMANLEGFGLPASQDSDAPRQWRKWLDELQLDLTMRPYANQQEVAARLQKNNPRLSTERAIFLSAHWAAPDANGAWQILGDPVHKRSSPLLYQLEQVLACWRNITAPVLWLEGADTDIWRWLGSKEEARHEIDRRIAHIPQVRSEIVANAGHMLHHDQPEMIAAMLEEFFLAK